MKILRDFVETHYGGALMSVCHFRPPFFYINRCLVIVFLGAGCVKSVGHQGALATSGLCQVGGEAEERLVHCGSCVKG